MRLSLDADVARRIEERVKSGALATPEEVVAAAMRVMEQQEQFDDFHAGEIDALLAKGERSIAAEGALDGEEAFWRRREKRAAETGGQRCGGK